METVEIMKLIGAIVGAYALLFLTMWLFKSKRKDKKSKK